MARALLFYLIVGAVVYFTYQLLGVGRFVSPTTERSMALEMLRGLMEVDGVLIGFVGLIATYIISEKVDLLRMLPQDVPQSVQVWKARKAIVDKLLDQKSTAAQTTGLIIVVLVGSILSTLHSMSYLGLNAGPADFFLPLLFLLWGIAGILWLLWTWTRR